MRKRECKLFRTSGLIKDVSCLNDDELDDDLLSLSFFYQTDFLSLVFLGLSFLSDVGCDDGLDEDKSSCWSSSSSSSS